MRKMLKICCSLLLLLLLSGLLSANPGVKVRMTQKGLEYAREVGLEILKQNMEKEHFPDLTGREKFGLGNIKYISRITQCFHLPPTGVWDKTGDWKCFSNHWYELEHKDLDVVCTALHVLGYFS